MAITEEKLLALGFTPADVQKLRKYIIKGELPLDMVCTSSDLS